MRLDTDDDIRRIHAVWLGPDEYSFPFHARYLAWVVWFNLFLTYLVVLWIIPGVGVTPITIIWGLCGTVVATSGALMLVDHERTMKSVAVTYWHEFRTPAKPPADTPHSTRVKARKVRVRQLPAGEHQ